MSSVKNGAKFSAIIGVAFAFMTTFFGGGWATGSQAGAYATQHGWTAIFMPLIGLFLIMCITWIVVEYCRLNETWNYAAFMERFYGHKIFKVIFDIIQIVSLPISFAACIATFASTLQQYVGGAYFMWVVVFAVIVIFSVIWGTAVVNKLAAFMGTAILILLLIIFATIIGTGHASTATEMVRNKTMYTSYGQAFYWGAIQFTMLTGGLSISLLPSFEPVKTRSDVTKACIFGFLFSGAFLFIVCFNVMSFMPEAIKETVPMLYGIMTMGANWLVPIYVVIVCLAVITTANAMCNGYGNRFINLDFLAKWNAKYMTKMIIISLIILAISSAVSMLGLTAIIYKAYSYMAYVNTPLVAVGVPVIGIIKLVQYKRRNLSLERGAMVGKKSWFMFAKEESK